VGYLRSDGYILVLEAVVTCDLSSPAAFGGGGRGVTKTRVQTEICIHIINTHQWEDVGNFEPREIATTIPFDSCLLSDQTAFISHANVNTSFVILNFSRTCKKT